MKVSLTSSANAELAEAQSFYTHSSDPRLGQAFALEFSRSIALMGIHRTSGRFGTARFASSRSAVFLTPSFIKFEKPIFSSSPSSINGGGPGPG